MNSIQEPDIIEQIGESLIQHGKLNDRVYIMKITDRDFASVMERAEDLCLNMGYTKIFAKIPEDLATGLLKNGYAAEARIGGFFNGKRDGIFISRYFDTERSVLSNGDEIQNILDLAENKKPENPSLLPEGDFHLRPLALKDAEKLAGLYTKVFKSYPFPVFDTEFLKKTMKENVEYAGIFYSGELVSAASAEKYMDFQNAEMTDFATLPDFRGRNFSGILLSFLEKRIRKTGIQTFYTIARAVSPGMNITFSKSGYTYSGTLVNNTNISGRMESMNVWAKSL